MNILSFLPLNISSNVASKIPGRFLTNVSVIEVHNLNNNVFDFLVNTLVKKFVLLSTGSSTVIFILI